jgi:stage III sporulation protein AA
MPVPAPQIRAEALRAVCRYLPPDVAGALVALPGETQAKVEEVRLRADGPLGITGSMGEPFVTRAGLPTTDPAMALVVPAAAVRNTLERMSGFSLYTLEEELRQGFLTLPGGHRVGLVGHALVRGGRLHAMKWIAALDIRLATAARALARTGVLPRIVDGEGGVLSTLVVAPPRAGKTTLLRELVRLVSSGVPECGVSGQSVGVVDERSELGGASEGVATLDLGPRTDLIDACPKAEGVFLLVRAMAPRVVATDEIGRPEDALSLVEAATAGVRVLATAHARDVAELMRRPSLEPLWRAHVVERFVVLSRRRGPGTVERVVDAEGRDAAVEAPAVRTGRPA